MDPEGTLWDVVIVGAGMGGSVLGWSLARQNFSVLYLERGDPVESPSGNSRERPAAATERLAAPTLSARESSRRFSSPS